jgi:hypothetical protein
MYDNRPISLDYAKVEVTWTNSEFDDDEINIPTPKGIMYLRGVIGCEVL